MADLSETAMSDLIAANQPAEATSPRSFWRRLCHVIIQLEWLWLLLILPPILFPTPTRALVMLLLPLLWLARWVATGRFVPPTPLNRTLLLFLVMVLVSLFATFDIGFTLSKLTGVVYGVALYFAVVAIAGRNSRNFYIGLAFFLLIGTALAALGLLTLRWSSTKIPFLEALLPHIPRLLISLPGATDGISPNQLGGMLLWLLPLAAIASLLPLLPAATLVWWQRPLLVIPAILMTLLMALIFLLTQSRSALLGFALALPLVALIPLWRFKLPLLGLAFLVVLAAFFFFTQSDQTAASLAERVASPLVSDVDDTLNHLQARFTIWTRAVAAIRDFPWTGIGLGTLRYVAPRLYPFYTSRLDEEVPHAHNHILQTALDLGLPGLVAYLGMWLGAAVMLRQLWRQATAGGSRLLVLAFAAALLAYFIYGLTDTVALGAKPGFLFWFLFGLIAAYHRTIVPVIWK
jgi:putative inorganic carbon (HCO3(-)) transporter